MEGLWNGLKKLVSILLVILVIFSLGVTVSANPTDSFVHEDTESGGVESVLSQEMYHATKVITAGSLGLEKSLSGMTDFCVDKDGNIYVLVSNWSQIVVLNKDYSLNRVLKLKDETGSSMFFTGAQGIFVDKDNKIYVCDTNSSRILIADANGAVVDTWGAPESDLIPEDFFYQPCRIVRNDKGYTYILSLGCYYGALLYSPDHKFLGFYGANNVEATALDTLSYLWERLTQTEEKKSLSVKTLPFSFVDLCLDSEDFMLTCTGKTEEDTNGTGQIRKLSPTGENIMFKRQTNGESLSANNINFLEGKVTVSYGKKQTQNIVSIDVDEDDFIYALDSQKGFIYIYDDECNMICGFGGGSDRSKRLSIFATASAIAVCGTDILVADMDSQTITVFELTEYGSLLKKAQCIYLDGEYLEAKPLWEEVNKRNKNCQLAYRGLAIAYLSEGNYEDALECARLGLDYTVYDLAWKVIKNEYILDNFVWIFIVAVALIGGLVAFLIIKKRKNLVLIKNAYVKTALSSTIHPFKAFEEIKYKQMGSMIIGSVILFLYYIANVLKETGSGFLATTVDINKYNTIYTIIETIGIVLLWSVCNWLITSSFDGKGNFKEVFIATTYSLIPLTLFTFIRVILSHMVSMSGLKIVDAVGVVVLILTFFLLCIAIMAVHEYDFFKFLSTAIVTVLFMILVAFVVFVVGILLQQVGEFFTSIFTEIFYR